MGIQGDRATSKAARFLEELLPRLEALGHVSSRKMFGGHGIFQKGQMFGIVSSAAELFFKTGPETLPAYRRARSPQHGSMPYFRVPRRVLGDDALLLAWARDAAALPQAAKRR